MMAVTTREVWTMAGEASELAARIGEVLRYSVRYGFQS